MRSDTIGGRTGQRGDRRTGDWIDGQIDWRTYWQIDREGDRQTNRRGEWRVGWSADQAMVGERL